MSEYYKEIWKGQVEGNVLLYHKASENISFNELMRIHYNKDSSLSSFAFKGTSAELKIADTCFIDAPPVRMATLCCISIKYRNSFSCL